MYRLERVPDLSLTGKRYSTPIFPEKSTKILLRKRNLSRNNRNVNENSGTKLYSREYTGKTSSKSTLQIMKDLKKNVHRKISSHSSYQGYFFIHAKNLVELYFLLSEIFVTIHIKPWPSVQFKLLLNRNEDRVVITRPFPRFFEESLIEYEVLYNFSDMYEEKCREIELFYESDISFSSSLNNKKIISSKYLKISDIIFSLFQAYIESVAKKYSSFKFSLSTNIKPKIGQSNSQKWKFRKSSITNKSLNPSISEIQIKRVGNSENFKIKAENSIFHSKYANGILSKPPVFLDSSIWIRCLLFLPQKCLIENISLVSRFFYAIINKICKDFHFQNTFFSDYLKKKYRRRNKEAFFLNRYFKNFKKNLSSLRLVSAKSCSDRNICYFENSEITSSPILCWTEEKDEIFVYDLKIQKIKRFTNVGNFWFAYNSYHNVLIYFKKTYVHVFSRNTLLHRIKIFDQLPLLSSNFYDQHQQHQQQQQQQKKKSSKKTSSSSRKKHNLDFENKNLSYISFEVSKKLLFIQKSNVVEIWRRFDEKSQNQDHSNSYTSLPPEKKIQEITMIDRKFVSMKIIRTKAIVPENNNNNNNNNNNGNNNTKSFSDSPKSSLGSESVLFESKKLKKKKKLKKYEELFFLINKSVNSIHNFFGKSTYNISIYNVHSNGSKIEFLISLSSNSFYPPQWIGEEEILWYEDSIKIYKVISRPPYLQLIYDLQKLTNTFNWTRKLCYSESKSKSKSKSISLSLSQSRIGNKNNNNRNKFYFPYLSKKKNENIRKKKKSKINSNCENNENENDGLHVILKKAILFYVLPNEPILVLLLENNRIVFWSCSVDMIIHEVNCKDMLKVKQGISKNVNIKIQGISVLVNDVLDVEIFVLASERFSSIGKILYSCFKFTEEEKI